MLSTFTRSLLLLSAVLLAGCAASTKPDDIPVSRLTAGDADFNAVQFYTASTISLDGNALISREDGLFYKGRKLNPEGSKVRVQGSTLCQKDGVAFYSTQGKANGVFSVDVASGEVRKIFTFADLGPEVARYNVSPLAVTADCSKLTFSLVAWPEKLGLRTEVFHGDYAERRNAVLFSSVFYGEKAGDGGWSVREIYREKRWLSHPDIEPLNGQYIVWTWDGIVDAVTAHVLNIATGKVVAIHSDDIQGRLIHPFWLGDGVHLGAIHWSSGPVSIARYNAQTGDYREVEVPGNWNVHEVSGKVLKNGNALVLTDGKVKGQPKITTGPIFVGEIDFDRLRFVSFKRIADYGARFAKDNKVLPGDEGWFPHPNISQDGRFGSFTSSNGRGDKGSDVYLVRLPD